MTSDSHRLSILTASEVDDLFGLPRFTEDDRRLYFDLSAAERETVNAHTPSVAAHLIVQLGYFKAGTVPEVSFCSQLLIWMSGSRLT